LAADRDQHAGVRLGVVGGLCLVALAGCTTPTKPPDRLILHRASFADLPGWEADDLGAALPALAASCKTLTAGKSNPSPIIDVRPEDWQAPCADLPAKPGKSVARNYIEHHFTPMLATNNDSESGLITGYYEAQLHGSKRPDKRYSVPLYRRPPDLGQVPYPTRAEIEAGALAKRGLELLWVDSAIDAFFLSIQGSGRVAMADGSTVRLGYDGDNGQPYVAIGRLLVEQGVPPEQMSMQYLRDWIGQHGKDGTALMDANPSYVFFRILKGPGPIGSEGVALTAGRSVAVDRHFIPMGLPLWLDTTDPVEPGGRLRRLMVAQDTGGAIKGPVRADIFFGYGEAAADHAGKMKGEGRYWLLVPNEAVPRLAPTG
jgi:membrane-bound lytic murein transglycosylase A